MSEQSSQLIAQGKTKRLFKTDDGRYLRMQFGDDITAFNGEKHDLLSGKGLFSNQFNAFIMNYLQTQGIQTHLVKKLSADTSLVHQLQMLPIECVVRNYAAGSLCKRLGLQDKLPLVEPLLEFFLKDDALGDPLITIAHIDAFQWATKIQVKDISNKSLAINKILSQYFNEKDLLLADFKLEFGALPDGTLVLGDEFTPDSCRIWDAKTLASYDKDVFRQGGGDTMDYYHAVSQRLGIAISSEMEQA